MYNLAITLYVREREEGRVTYILAMTLSVGERESCVHLGHGTLCKREGGKESCVQRGHGRPAIQANRLVIRGDRERHPAHDSRTPLAEGPVLPPVWPPYLRILSPRSPSLSSLLPGVFSP